MPALVAGIHDLLCLAKERRGCADQVRAWRL